MSKFEYPKLPRQEIIVVLAESQIDNVTEAQLLRPDYDFICNLYTKILFSIDVLQEEQEQMEFGALEVLENPENHSHSIQVMNLFNKIRQILAAVSCPRAFTPKDLIKPEPERTELFLSALLNFYLHRHLKLSLCKPILEDLNLLEERQINAEARMSELNAEIAEFEELRERELPDVEEVNSKVKELEQTVSGLNKHQVNLKSSIKQFKEKSKEMDDKISNAEFALVQSCQENASLRSKIVQSPDKLQRALEDKKLVHTEAKDAERTAMQSFQEKTTTLEAYAKATKKISKHFDRMQAVQEQVNNAKSVEKEVKDLKSKLGDEEVKVKSLEAKIVEMQSKANQLKESKRQVEKERAILHEDVDKEIKNVNLEVESKKRALELRQREVESLVVEADAVTSRRQAVRKEGEATALELGRKCEEIVAEFEKYSTSISNVLATTGMDKVEATDGRRS